MTTPSAVPTGTSVQHCGWFDSVRIKTVLLLLVFGILPATVLFGIVVGQRGEFRDKLTVPLSSAAQALSDAVNRNLFERYGDVQAFGLNAAAHDRANWARPAPDNALVAAMNGYMTGYGLYKLMMLVAPDGRVLAVNSVDPKGNPLDTARLYALSFRDAPWLKRALAGDFLKGQGGLTGTVMEPPRPEPIVAEFYRGDGLVIPFSAPVKNPAGETIGVWVNFADFGLVEEIAGEYYARLANDGMERAEITVIDRTGVVLVDFDPKGQGFTRAADYRRDPVVIGRLNLIEAGVEAARRAARGEHGETVSLHARKKIEVATGFAATEVVNGFSGLGWGYLVRGPSEEVFALWNGLIRVSLIALGALIALLLALGYWIGTRAAQPLSGMASAMHRLAEGDKSIAIPAVGRRDEIGAMGQALAVFKQKLIEAERLEAEKKAADEAARAEVTRREAEQREAEEHAREERRKAVLALADSFE